MSRSVIKNPFIKLFGKHCSNKKDRTIANKKYRHVCNQLLRVGEEHFPNFREITDTWDFLSDGLAVYDKEVMSSYKYKCK